MSGQKAGIRDKCSVNVNEGRDNFVGIACENGDIRISFPMGYHLSDKEEELCQDIFLLIKVLGLYAGKGNAGIPGNIESYDHVCFPVQAYIEIICDYYARGYYCERETAYKVSKSGKISWSRTIKTQKPHIQDRDVFYLDFVTKETALDENELITRIHEYCVYDSFEKMRWLFGAGMPPKPRIKFQKGLFLTAVKEKLSHTYNDRNRRLFWNMLAVIEYMGDDSQKKNYKYGTYRFEYVWEKLVDRTYGIPDKSVYFPKTVWRIGGRSIVNACLEPDTIMVYGEDLYVLDAKYYKYGVTGNIRDLPESSSISKQIIYGEYIAENNKFQKLHGDKYIVYNAFIMPFDAEHGGMQEKVIKIGEAVSTWKFEKKQYEMIQGILIDTKYLMALAVRQGETEKRKLAEIISGV